MLTRWLVAGGILASGAVSVLVARAQPGRSTSHVTTARAAAPEPQPSAPSFEDDAGGNDAGLAPPPVAPERGSGRGVVVSGGS